MLRLSISNVQRFQGLWGVRPRQGASAAARAERTDPRSAPLAQDFAPEAEQLGRAPSGPGVDAAGLLHQPATLHQPAEILRMQAQASQRLDDALQLGEGELVLDQLEYQRAVAQLAAQAGEAGGQDAPMVVRHGLAEQARSGGRLAPLVDP